MKTTRAIKRAKALARKHRLVGKQYGFLTVLRRYAGEYWECLCACGRIKTIRGYRFTSGEIKSCGCKRYVCTPEHADAISAAALAKYARMTPEERGAHVKRGWTTRRLNKPPQRPKMTTRQKRYRIVPEAPPGKLQIRYGRADRFDYNPDIVYNRGFGVPTCDAHLLHNIMGSKRLGLEFPSGKTIEEPSLFDELKARGYDISTLEFTIWQTGKKPKPTQKPKPGPWKKWNLFTVFWKNGVREVFRGQGDTPMEAFELDGQKEEGEIFHWELGSNRSYVWEETERRWIRNERPTPTWETK